jgi:hypothetical protein
VRYVYALAVILLVSMVGCADKEAATQAEKRHLFSQALDKVKEADIGYMPTEQMKQGMRLTEYRLDRYRTARADLEKVITSPNASQRLAARQLLAHMYGSEARAQFRHAQTVSLDAAQSGAMLLRDLIEVDRAQERVKSFTVDNSETVSHLKNEQSRAQGEIKGMEQDRRQLDSRIDKLQAERKQLTQQADADLAEEVRINDEAFLISSAEKYDLLDKATALKHRGFATRANAQKLDVMINIYESERLVLARSIASMQAFAEALGEQVTLADQWQQQTNDSLAKAESQLAKATAKLDSAKRAIAADFDESVQDAFDQADATVDVALDLLADAASSDRAALPNGSTSLDTQRLGALMTKLRIQTAHVLALASLGSTFSVVEASADGSEHPTVAQIADKQAALIAKVVDVVNEAQKIAEALAQRADSGDPIHAQLEHLRSYIDRIEPASMRPIQRTADSKE